MSTQHHDPRAMRRLSAWLDGELDPAEADRLLERFDSDPALREEAERLEQLDRLIEQWPAPVRVPDVRAAVLARVAASTIPWPARLLGLPWRQFAPTAGWAVAGIIAGLMIMPLLAPRAGAGPDPDETIFSMGQVHEVALISHLPDFDADRGR